MEVKLKRVSLREKFEYPSLNTEKISSKQLKHLFNQFIGVSCLCYNLDNYKSIHL